MSAPIFISYSSKDRDTAETICQALEARGLNCWISCRDVHPGENFQEAIVRTLRTARVMLLVFTSNANNSDEIKKELVLAGRHRVAVVPVRVEDVVPSDAFAYEFATRQWIDLFRNWEEEIERLAGRIRTILATPPAEDGAQAETPAAAVVPGRSGKSASRSLLLFGSIVALGVLIAAGGAILYWRLAGPGTANNTDEAAWKLADGEANVAAYKSYLKQFPGGGHVRDAQARLADLILAAPATARNFDGTWTTTWTCANVGNSPGYAYRLAGEIKDGNYHGLRGAKGEPGSFDLTGKIEADGSAAFFGEIVVASSVVALGAPRGTVVDFRVVAQFAQASGEGARIDGRPCAISFAKQ